ncbi:unnamed protein product [Candidula unifasciata]|uniref:Sex-determining region Y protein n=1 Tax=Candidula unifasciata TaxID=100452 RepID=A0A8S3YUC9_9EUPU|nr:unnamed protein product [Candidula unifasciata]
MDYYHDSDPLISSAIYPGVMDFDPYSRPKILDDPIDIPMNMHSPDSIETYNESEMELTFHDTGSVSSVASVTDEVSDSVASTPQKEDDADIEADRRLVNERFAPFDMFPVDNSWTIEERIEKLLQMSPCRLYTKEDLLNIDSIESPEKKVDMLIEIVSKVHVNHRWNYVQPHELHRGYTVVANCKKEKKKDSDGHSCPKRPMNAFMIWSMKCRALIAQITPQLHNAIISTKLGAAWRRFDDQEKAIYEREKDTLGTFHKFEFPDYKYKPKKKAKRTEEKPVSEPKQPKCLKRKRNENNNNQPLPLRGINIADARQNLDPLLKERLIVKMQVKIDPVLKKGIGKRVTAIDLADLTALHQRELAKHSLVNTQRFQNTPSTVQLIIDSKPTSVFDTPENSPNKPITPGTPTDQSLGHDRDGLIRSDRCFEFDNSSLLYPLEADNASHGEGIPETRVKIESALPIKESEPTLQWNLIKIEPDLQSNIKSEPIWNFNLSIKTEPLEYASLYSTHGFIKSEPEQICPSVLVEGSMPILSADVVDSVLDSDCTSSFNNEELLDDFMKYLDSDIGFSADLLPCVTTLPEGPATV